MKRDYKTILAGMFRNGVPNQARMIEALERLLDATYWDGSWDGDCTGIHAECVGIARAQCEFAGVHQTFADDSVRVLAHRYMLLKSPQYSVLSALESLSRR